MGSWCLELRAPTSLCIGWTVWEASSNQSENNSNHITVPQELLKIPGRICCISGPRGCYREHQLVITALFFNFFYFFNLWELLEENLFPYPHQSCTETEGPISLLTTSKLLNFLSGWQRNIFTKLVNGRDYPSKKLSPKNNSDAVREMYSHKKQLFQTPVVSLRNILSSYKPLFL